MSSIRIKLIYLIITINFSSNLMAQTCPNALNGQPGKLIPVSKVMTLESDFLKNHPICQDKKSCLSSNDLLLMKEKGLLPRKGDFTQSRQFKYKIKFAGNVCLDPRKNSILGAHSSFNETLDATSQITPKISQMANQLVHNTKKNVDDYISDSQALNRLIQFCLRHNEKMEKAGVPFHQRMNQAKKDKEIPKECAVIWRPDSEIPKLTTQIKEYRQTLFLINLINKKEFKEPQDLFKYVKSLSRDSSLKSDIAILNSKLEPSRTRFLGTLLPSTLWSNSAEYLEPLNATEIHGLEETLQNIVSRSDHNNEVENIKKNLSVNYFKMLNKNPLLMEFKSAQPNAAELKSAYDNFNLKLAKLSEFQMKDPIEYLSFPSAVNAAISQAPIEDQGDMCLLANQMIADQRKLQDGLENLLLTTMALESLGASLLAKGAINKIVGLLTGARYSGSAFMVKQVNDGLNSISKNNQMCLSTMTNSNELCSVDQVNQAQENLTTHVTLLGVFALPRRAAPYIGTILSTQSQDAN